MKAHKIAELFPLATQQELETMAADIKENGLKIPIILLDGEILDGRNRFAACELAGVQPRFIDYQGKNPLRDVISWNLHRRHLTESQRADVGRKVALLPLGSNQYGSANLPTQKQAAEMMNVSERLIRDAALVARESPALAAQVAAGDLTVHAAIKIIRPHVAQNSGDNEWYTPKNIVEAAKAVLGEIDLDPASHADANKVVKAKKFFTAEEDGLKQKWTGRVFLNPPYAGELIGKFMEKLASAAEAKNISTAIVLVNNATETRWFARLAGVSAALCFPTGRVKFWHPRKEAVPLQGQCIAYLGKDLTAFQKNFKKFGIVAEILRSTTQP